MTRIVCGWCGNATDVGACLYCARDPEQPWVQRGQSAPVIADHDTGRPALDERDIRQRYAEAQHAIEAEGRAATVEAIAERLDRSPRTVREWRRKFAL